MYEDYMKWRTIISNSEEAETMYYCWRVFVEWVAYFAWMAGWFVWASAVNNKVKNIWKAGSAVKRGEYKRVKLEKEWKGQNIKSAVETLWSLKWKSFEEAKQILENKWFKYNWRTPWWYDKFKHPDWSEIQIRPNGEVVRVKRVWTSDWSKKYPQRYDENGEPTDKHNTCLLYTSPSPRD